MTISRWLYDELRGAILERRLRAGTRVPATRDLAEAYGISRGTSVAVFEQLKSEGYLETRVGAGTFVSASLPDDLLHARTPSSAPRLAGEALERRPRAARPFRSYEPALDRFPMDVWVRVASRRLRRVTPSLLANGDSRGYRPLREAIAGYLGASRGVRCAPEQVIVITGVQAGLNLLAQMLFKPGDTVAVEDPAYPGALVAFENARAKIIPIPVDRYGIDVARFERLSSSPKAAYVTPAHQCPLGITMSIDRRLALLDWARRSGAFIFEDDYDSEYRYSGRPVPALQGLDQNESVIFLGTFNKVLFPSLRIGYMVVPPRLVEPVAKRRAYIDRYSSSVDQAILCDFITEGHFGRHIRRMRNLYAGRLGALTTAVEHYLKGLLELAPVEAGLCAPAILPPAINALAAQAAAAELNLETVALERLCRKRTDIHGLLLGFAAFDEVEIRRGVMQLAVALESLLGAKKSRTLPRGA